MSALVPIVQVPETQPKAPVLQVHLDDALASARRIWLRGRLSGPALQPAATPNGRPWWDWRPRSAPAESPPLSAHIEIKVSGSTVTAEVPVGPDGRFEVLLPVDLPLARRGWRVARQRVTFGGQTVDACSVCLVPRAEATQAVAVLLPLQFTLDDAGAQRLASCDAGPRLAKLLHKLKDGPGGHHAIYYVACTPEGTESRQAKLALAVTSLGWPAGNVVTVRPDRDGRPAAALATALDRLRWLFAGVLDLVVFNLEPEIAGSLHGSLAQAEDLAKVRKLFNPEDDFATVLGDSQGHRSSAVARTPRRTRAALLPRYPVVFCHGMLACSTLKMQLPEDLNCFSVLRDFLKDRGFCALFPQVPPTSGVVERAESLREQILRWTDEPINLIAHSMGGLDARYMITHLGMADRVRTLTTVCTSHRGTYLADWFVANFRQRVPLLRALEAFGMNMDGFQDCCLAACREFNAKTPDRPEVRYFSFGGEVPLARVAPFLRRAWHILTPVEGPNDGMVSKASAHWGEYLGTVHADHFAQTPDAVFLRPGEDFDALGFYVKLVQNLARRGF